MAQILVRTEMEYPAQERLADSPLCKPRKALSVHPMGMLGLHRYKVKQRQILHGACCIIMATGRDDDHYKPSALVNEICRVSGMKKHVELPVIRDTG